MSRYTVLDSIIFSWVWQSCIQDREVINRLFEEWIQADENWMNSSIMMNHTRTKAQRRRGKHVTKTFRELKTQYGPATAKAIRERKKEMGPGWWWVHPDLPDQEETWSFM